MSILETIKANRANADKASAYDGLQQEYLANKARYMQMMKQDEMSRYMEPFRAAQMDRDFYQEGNGGLAASNVARQEYNDGISAADAEKLRLIDAAMARQTARDDATLKTAPSWDTPEVYRAIQRLDGNVDRGLSAEGMR